jgi:hypothetical protein
VDINAEIGYIHGVISSVYVAFTALEGHEDAEVIYGWIRTRAFGHYQSHNLHFSNDMPLVALGNLQ